LKIIHPYEDLNGGAWLRGNLHTHTTRSDGTCSIQKHVGSDFSARIGQVDENSMEIDFPEDRSFVRFEY